MIEALIGLVIFIIKVVVVGLVIAMTFASLISLGKKKSEDSGLKLTHINDEEKKREQKFKLEIYDKKKQKALKKELKKDKKNTAQEKPKLWLLDFKGDISATQTQALREEISLILSLIEKGDEVAVRLENPGGAVHEHGLAASQLLRFKDRGIPLTVLVDKVAASGGYLMACVADKILAAPFAIIGSIGVIAQLPNFNRWLEERGIDFEQVTAGKHKRTLTMFGKNTEEGREKLKEEIEDIHALFKDQIVKYRPDLDIDSVSTGEYWYGARAIELGLIDEIITSDDYLANAKDNFDVYLTKLTKPQSFKEKLFNKAKLFFGI
ncbi:MAG: protease SohB [Gammaproteobacteria bacterium]|jgi:serine protease SohB